MERDYKKESDCSVARARYLPLQIWYLTSPRLSAALPISTPASTSSAVPQSPFVFPQDALFTSLELPFAVSFLLPPVDQTRVSYLRSTGILSLYMSIIHIFAHLCKNKHTIYAFHPHIFTHCLYQRFPSDVVHTGCMCYQFFTKALDAF